MPFLFYMLKKIRFDLVFIFLILIFSIPSVWGLFQSGFPLTDDGNWMVIRFSAFYEALRDGQFPVRFLSRLNYGYGYPVADFLYPLFMYFGVPIHLIGLNFQDVVKIILAGSMVSSGIFSYLWFRKIFSEISSFVGSLVYVYFPYHLWDLYKRGSVGEVLALSIVPFILWTIEKRSIFLESLGYALLITAHNSLALIFLPVIVGYEFIKIKKIEIKALIPLGFGIGLSSFFWLPALYDRQFTKFNNTEVSDFLQYFINPSMWNLLGPIFAISLLIGIFLILKNRTLSVIYFFIVSALSLFLSLSISDPIWKIFGLGTYIQFPFRFLSLSILSASFIISYFLNQSKSKLLILFSVFFVVLVFISSSYFLSPQSYQNYPDTFYSTNQDTTTVKNEYMPIWVKKEPQNMAENKVEIEQGSGIIKNIFYNSKTVRFDADIDKDSRVKISTVYFPGWVAFDNNKGTAIEYNNDMGLINIPLSKGAHSVKVIFTETPIRIFADILSILSFFALIYVSFKKN